jgi:hypothetical protein
MAKGRKEKDLLTRLSDAGEDAISRVTGSQATTRVMETVGGMRDRLDDLQKRVRGLDDLEKRVTKLEKRLDDLSKPKRTTTRSRSTTRKATGTASRSKRSSSS